LRLPPRRSPRGRHVSFYLQTAARIVEMVVWTVQMIGGKRQ